MKRIAALTILALCAVAQARTIGTFVNKGGGAIELTSDYRLVKGKEPCTLAVATVPTSDRVLRGCWVIVESLQLVTVIWDTGVLKSYPLAELTEGPARPIRRAPPLTPATPPEYSAPAYTPAPSPPARSIWDIPTYRPGDNVPPYEHIPPPPSTYRPGNFPNHPTVEINL